MVDKNMTIRTQNHYHFYDHRNKNINNILHIIDITNGVYKYVKVIKLKKSFKSLKTLNTITIIIDLKMNIVYITSYYPTRLLSVEILENNG